MVNDQYGHLAGDKVLRDVSQTIFNNIRSKAIVTFNGKTVTRPVDIIGRYGGEEFVFVMKNITPENASSRINQIREKIGKLNSEFVYPNDGKEVHIPVTASFGVAHITKELLSSLDFTEENVEEVCNYFIEEADEMLYKSKHNGRNVVSLKKVNQNTLDNSSIIADEDKTKAI
jgi:PleD family two-component response regulator